MSDRTIIEGGSPESPGGPKTLIEGSGSGTPADGRTVLEQSGTPVGQSPIGINSINLVPGVQIAGCVLREQLRVISGEADLWLAEQPGRQELAVLKVFRWGVQPKAEVAAKLRSIPKAQVVEVLGSGVLSDGRHYELLEYIQEGTLANLMQPGGVSSSLARQILLELTEALAEIHAAGILHRDLKPSNILIRRREPLDLVLTDFGISSLSDQTSLYVTTAHRTAAYSAPEAMTGVIGSSSDWWSVGVMLLELLTGRHPFAGMDERIVNFQLVSRGIEVPVSLPDEWQLLLKGLLTRDHQKRWGGEQVRAWLAGQRDIPVFYQTGPQQAAQYKPYKFLGKDCATPAELAREAGQAKNWDEGVKSLQRRYIQDWVKQDVRDFDLLSKLQDIEDDKNLDWEQKLCAALLVLDPELPLCWRGEIVTHDWISAQATQGTQHLNKALALLTSSLPEWLQRCRDQTWTLELRQRRQRLQTEVGRLGLNLPRGDVDKVIFLPFEAVSTEAQRRKEAAHSAATDADESLKALLAKPEWNEAECVAVVACPFSRFLTKEQQWLAVKNLTTSEITSLSEKVENTKNILELEHCTSRLDELKSNLDVHFQSLSHPNPFPCDDNSLRDRIAKGTKRCQQRSRLLKTARTIKFAVSGGIIIAVIGVSIYGWLRFHTRIHFSLNVEGVEITPNDSIKAFWDGTEVFSGQNLSPGKGVFTVNDSRLLPFTTEADIRLGKTLDLGAVALKTRRVAIQFQSVPSGANIFSNGKQLGTTPFELSDFPLFKTELQASLNRHRFVRIETNSVGTNQIQMSFILNQVPGNEVLWQYNNGETPTAVASVDERGNTYCSTGNRITKLDPDGKKLWEFREDYQNFGLVVVRGEYIFVGGKRFLALRASDGKVAWNRFVKSDASVTGDFLPPAIGSGDNVFTGFGGEIVSLTLPGNLNWETDNLKFDNEWLFRPKFNLGSTPLILADGTIIYHLTDSLRAVNPASGQRVWWFKPDDNSSPGPPAGVGNKVFVVCGRSVYCLDSITQKRLWKISIDHDLNNEVVVSSDNQVIFGGMDKLYVYDANLGTQTKTVRLQYSNGDQLRQDALALGNDNLVYVGGNFGLKCMDRKTGSVSWSSQIGGGWIHGITVSKSGRILARGNDGLYLLSGDADNGPSHPWPMLYGNEAHTGRAQQGSGWSN
jgi:serine/threonine protein kinase/outer membrane protein assembly factor BamB